MFLSCTACFQIRDTGRTNPTSPTPTQLVSTYDLGVEDPIESHDLWFTLGFMAVNGEWLFYTIAVYSNYVTMCIYIHIYIYASSYIILHIKLVGRRVKIDFWESFSVAHSDEHIISRFAVLYVDRPIFGHGFSSGAM